MVDLSSQAWNDPSCVDLAFRYVLLSALAAPDNAVDAAAAAAAAAAVDARLFALAVDVVAPAFGQSALQRHARDYSLRVAAVVDSAELVLWPDGGNEGHEVGELAEAQEALGWL